MLSQPAEPEYGHSAGARDDLRFRQAFIFRNISVGHASSAVDRVPIEPPWGRGTRTGVLALTTDVLGPLLRLIERPPRI